jgi:uncharacterized membrane protein YdjX (TVP38/TMEM64 family)
MTLVGAIRRYGLIALVVGLLVAAIASGLWRHLTLGELAAHRVMLTRYVAAHPVLSLLIYLGAYILVVVACIPGPSVMTTTAGFLFGTIIGGFAALAACTIGSVIVFLACRTAFGDWATRKAGPVVQRIEQGFAKNAFSYLLTMRLIPVVPFPATNIAAGLAGVRLSALVGATLIGSAPVCFILAGLGAGLGGIMDAGGKVDASLLEQPRFILPLVGLAVMSTGPILWRLWRKQR